MRSSRLTTFFVGIAAIAGLASFAVTGVSAASVPAGPLAQADAGHVLQQTAPGTAGTYSGTVKQNGPTLVTHDNQGDRTLTVAPGATVMRDGKAVAISDLKKGDKLTASLDANGVVQRIDASAPHSSANVLLWLIPLLIVAVLLIGLLAWLMSRRHKGGFVVERRTHRGSAV